MTFQHWWDNSRWAGCPWSQAKMAAREAWDEAIRQAGAVHQAPAETQVWSASVEDGPSSDEAAGESSYRGYYKDGIYKEY